MKSIKITVVGDEGVGKTSLMITYTTANFPEKLHRTYDHYSCNVLIDGKPINVCLWDTAGESTFDHLRPLSYAGTDVFFICFSLNDPNSLENVRRKWNPELVHYAPDTPVILVGTKLDLRNVETKRVSLSARGSATRRSTGAADKLYQIHQIQQQRQAPYVDHEQGLDMAKEIDAIKYVECSALMKKNLNLLVDEAIRCVLYPECKEHKERNCQKCDKEPKGSMCTIQ